MSLLEIRVNHTRKEIIIISLIINLISLIINLISLIIITSLNVCVIKCNYYYSLKIRVNNTRKDKTLYNTRKRSNMYKNCSSILKTVFNQFF